MVRRSGTEVVSSVEWKDIHTLLQCWVFCHYSSHVLILSRLLKRPWHPQVQTLQQLCKHGSITTDWTAS